MPNSPCSPCEEPWYHLQAHPGSLQEAALSCAGDHENIPAVCSTCSRTSQFFYVFTSFNCGFLKMSNIYLIPT